MIQAADQVFVWFKHWLVGLFPHTWQPCVSSLLTCIGIILVFALLFAIITWVERKGLGRIQNRFGPNRVGPWGLFQPVADGFKMLTKEDVVPRAADRVVFFLAPVVLVVSVLLAFSVLPFGRNMVPIDLDAGVVFFFAAGASTELSVFMAGWGSRNKYSLLGAMRAIAQMISYEMSLILSAIPVIMVAGSLSTVKIVAAQAHYTWGIAHWYLFTPWGLAGFLLFMTAAAAESNRSPFDIPEAESELTAGYFVEYSGFRFALFFMGEYFGMFATGGLAITLFLGGWSAPFSFLTWIPSYLWFFAKLFALLGMFIWVRGTLPRLRMDQLMNFAWKFMLPMVLLNIVVTGVWRWLPHLWGWIVCAILLLAAYWGLSQALVRGRRWAKRTYRFAS